MESNYGILKERNWIIELVGGKFDGIMSDKNPTSFKENASIKRSTAFEDLPETVEYRGKQYRKKSALIDYAKYECMCSVK